MLRLLSVPLLALMPLVGWAGVTIHYTGKISSADQIEEFLLKAEDFADKKSWRHERRGAVLTLFPHEWSEPIEIEFKATTLKSNFVKTQFAGASVHICVIDFFREMERMLVELEVEDEGEYWESRDLDGLNKNLEAVVILMEKIKRTQSGVKGPTKTPEGRILDLYR